MQPNGRLKFANEGLEASIGASIEAYTLVIAQRQASTRDGT